MAEAKEVVVAENGTVIEAGGVYLTFSGDSECRYAVVKVISIGCGLGGAAECIRVLPDLTPVVSPDLWVKLSYALHAEPPEGWAMTALMGKSRILPITMDMLLSWEPPKFPIRLGTEPVTVDELAARVEDWLLREPENGTA